MSNLTVSAFVPNDYVEALRACGPSAAVTTPRPLEVGLLYARYGPCFTIRREGEIAAVLGLMIPWDGHADCWALLTPLGLRHGALIHRTTILYLRRLIRDYKIRRLQADVIATFAAGRRWLEHLGFHEEGLMPSYGPQGETFARFAWINPKQLPQDPEVERELAGVTTEEGIFVSAISGGYDGGASIYIMVALTVAAAAASAYATYSSSQAQEQAMKYNAAEAEKQAEMAREQQKFAAQQQSERDRRTRAAARAIQGSSGVEVGEGSSLLTDLDSAKQAELNYQAIRYQGDAQVRSLQSQATLDRFQASTAKRQGLIGAGASLLGGLSSGASTYARTPSAAPKTITVPSSSVYAEG